ncbi:uncharacterized protein Tco025E_02213 [Trypanosoma conorhini]|uniref:Uncharacterized protein n=1 Tax=Trypanosoma conorhini TaxID=83891 RepID=A0A3R7M2I4_9TRYP|nr:uncharacterized protein Tco025E_02213 [Trypanosoma conorhini]RNF25375.1 hypothetical protein Tco025E_02213 [Trypanosoma conorhini]
MALLHHRWYDADLTAVAEGGSGLRETRMSWSHTDPAGEETVAVLLLAAPATLQEPADGDGGVYALKVILFAAAEAGSQGVAGEEAPRQEVHNAVFELHAPLDVSVVKGTSGLVFASTRQFFFHATAGGKSLDRFVFLPAEKTWERQRHALQPLDAVEPVRRVLAEANGDSQPQLLLVARSGAPPAPASLAEGDRVEMLVVASRRAGAAGSSQGRQRTMVTAKRKASASDPPATPLYTFVLAVVRCTVQVTRVAVANWELLHLCVDRGVPFQQHQQQRLGGLQTWTNGDSEIHPGRCTWCYISSPNVEAAEVGGEGEGGQANKKATETSRAGGVVVALVPQPSSVVTVVCGGFDAKCHAYRLGFVATPATGGSSVPQHSVEDTDSPEETLWSLSEDTHTVQMMLVGAPTTSLRGSEATDARRTTPRRRGQHVCGSDSAYGTGCASSGEGWMRQAGLSKVLRFVVDFLDDGMGGVSADPAVGSRGGQGLYFASVAPWSASRQGRFPIPRSVCWVDTAPLPIGKALTCMLLFPASDGAEKGDGDVTAMDAAVDDEDAASWCHTLPTSVASALPVAATHGTLRCFLGVNVLLKKTRLTYVLEVDAAAQASNRRKGIRPTEWLYTRPRARKSLLHENTEEEEERQAACLARYAAMQNTRPSAVDGLRTTVLQDSLLDRTTPEAVVHAAWRSVGVGGCAAANMAALERVAQGTGENPTQEVRALANRLLQFLLTFLVELDWMTHTDNDLLRGVTLLLLGAVDTKKASPDRRESSLRDGASLVSRLAANERRSMHWLLSHSERWSPLAAALFAWVNQGLIPDASEAEILLEDVVQAWEETAACPPGGGCALEDILKRLRASQDALKYHNALLLLLRGNLSLHETASFAVWNDVAVRDPSILFLQLLLEAAVACEDAATDAAASISSLEISRITMSVVQARLQSAGTLAALLQLMHAWNFSFLADWPLAAMSGGLPVAHLIRHLTTADSSEAERAAHRPVAQAAQVLLWLCGDCVERAAEVLEALRAAKVPLLALCVAGSDRRGRFGVPETAPSSSSSSSSGGGGGNTSRALHHVLASSTAAVLAGALAEPGGRGPTDDTTSEAFVLQLWMRVLEGDEAAAFNPGLLQRLHEALVVGGRGATRPKHVCGAALLLDFLRPVFLSTLPRLLAAVGEQHETVGSALAAGAASLTAAGVAALGPPLGETETIEHVWLATLQELGRLLQLHVEDSLEVRCLALLFKAFEASSATLLAESRSGSEASSTTGLCFTFSPAEMYFLALQILSNEPAGFVINVEVMRRRLAPYLLHEMELATRRADEVVETSNTKALWWDSKAYINTVADGLALVIAAFEATAPLYSHAMLLLFLDESLAVMADVERRPSGGRERPLSAEVRSEMLQCTRRVALSRWAKLHRQEKKLIARVLSRRLAIPGQEQAEGDVYQESDVHHSVAKDAAHMKKTLQQRPVNAALLRAIRRKFSRDSSGARSTSHTESHDDAGIGTVTSLTDVTLLLKEETYVRQCLQRQLMRSHNAFVGSEAFRGALGTLYLALREEQRRRVFVAFVREQHDIILSFACAALVVMYEARRRGAHVLQQNALEHLQRQLRYFFLQERESRAAVEAVCLVERQLLLELASQQRAMADAERGLRLRLVEEEEVHRDACYELFAREELAAQRRCEARLEEEAWREEEAQWAQEQQRRQADEDGGDAERRSPPNAYLQWQQRRLAAAATAAKTSTSLPLQPPPPPAEVSHASSLTASVPPANALAPLLQMDSAPAMSAEDGGYHALVDASESLFSAFSRLQKQIISTVAPPPATGVKKDAPALAPADVPSAALQMPASVTASEERWEDAVEDAAPPSTQAGNEAQTAKMDHGALDAPPNTHEDSIKRLRLRALATTGKRRAPRQRRLGEVFCLEGKPAAEKAEVGDARGAAKLHEEEQQARKEASPSVEEAKPAPAPAAPGMLKNEEEEEAVALALCPEPSLALQSEEGTARYALCREERVVRAFLFRYFTLTT